jgi:hypothetical protein
MASIRSVQLDMGRRASGSEFARITGFLDFTGREVQENLNYAVWVAIDEVDDARDVYNFYTNGQGKPEVLKVARGDTDDSVRQFFLAQTIRPGGRNSVTIEVERDFDVGNQEEDNEEYQATILAIPEITHGYALSNVRSINLG